MKNSASSRKENERNQETKKMVLIPGKIALTTFRLDLPALKVKLNSSCEFVLKQV